MRDFYEIYQDKEHFHYLINKGFDQLGKQLNAFLSEGNYLKIVISMDMHDPVDFLFKEFISRVYEVVGPYRNQAQVFLTSGEGNRADVDLLAKVAKISQIDEYFYAENENGVSAYIIDDKTDVFEFVKKEHNLEIDHLFAIGDSSRDIPMLFKCIKLGGKSSLINNYLYRTDKCEDITTDSIVKNTVSMNFEIMIENIAYQLHSKFKDYDILKQMDILEQLIEEFENKEYGEWCYTEYNKIYNSLRIGELDLNELLKKLMIYRIVSEYNLKCGIRTNKTYDSKTMNELTMYPTFANYCDKVLIHQKNKN